MVVTGCAGKEDMYTPTSGISGVNKWVEGRLEGHLRMPINVRGWIDTLNGLRTVTFTPLERAENLSNPAGSCPVDERTLRC